MLITLWELIAVRRSSPPSAAIRWCARIFGSRARCAGSIPPPRHRPRPRARNFEATLIFIPLVPKTRCCFSLFFSPCCSSPNFFSIRCGEAGPGGRWRYLEGGRSVPLRAGCPQGTPGHPGGGGFSFFCSLTHLCSPVPFLSGYGRVSP